MPVFKYWKIEIVETTNYKVILRINLMQRFFRLPRPTTRVFLMQSKQFSKKSEFEGASFGIFGDESLADPAMDNEVYKKFKEAIKGDCNLQS